MQKANSGWLLHIKGRQHKIQLAILLRITLRRNICLLFLYTVLQKFYRVPFRDIWKKSVIQNSKQ